MDLREAQVIELFHVAFLDALQQRLERGRWILKGGANLRYFFDLLLRRRELPRGELGADLLAKAAEIALEIPFDAFSDHVLNFLEPELRDYYDSEERWVQTQTFVAEKLEAAR
jgi:hypothetical protein